MEFGDIIYFILLVFFMILGFFNDSRKKKNQKKQLEEEKTAYPGEGQEAIPPRAVPHPVGRSPKKEGRPVFQSSMDQVTDYKKYDSGDNIEFDYDAHSIDDFETGSPMISRTTTYTSPTMPPAPPASVNRKTSDGKNRGGTHPLVADLHGDNGINALKKGLIYSEILQRRY